MYKIFLILSFQFNLTKTTNSFPQIEYISPFIHFSKASNLLQILQNDGVSMQGKWRRGLVIHEDAPVLVVFLVAVEVLLKTLILFGEGLTDGICYHQHRVHG